MSKDTIYRQDAIDAVDSETVGTNPEHFKSSEKFIKFMDDVDIASFGKWQWANGFNTALVATSIQLKKLPSAQQELQSTCNKLATDCISRQAAIQAVETKIKKWNAVDGEGYHVGLGLRYTDVIDTLTELPSAQTEIIRCKECKHRPVDSEDTQGFGVEFPDEKCPCQCEDGWYNWRPDDEWFCANAERREE